MSATPKSHPEPAWCVVANVVSERLHGPGGMETRRGTKHFSPGTKVYVRHAFWGMAGDSVEVIARHRGRAGFVVMVISTEWLENWRVTLAYSPKVIALLQAEPDHEGTPDRGDGLHRWDGSPASREAAEKWTETLARIAQSKRERRASKRTK